MKIAFTAKGETWESKMDPRFGRTDYLFMYDDQTEEIKTVDNQEVQSAAHGAGPQTAKKLFELAPDVLITGNGPGGNAATVLAGTELRVFTGAGDMTVKQAFNAWKDGELTAF